MLQHRAKLDQRDRSAPADDDETDEDRRQVAHEHDHEHLSHARCLSGGLEPVERLVNHGQPDDGARYQDGRQGRRPGLPQRSMKLRAHAPAPVDRPAGLADDLEADAEGEKQGMGEVEDRLADRTQTSADSPRLAERRRPGALYAHICPASK